jgi:hypothetical protein
MQVVGVLPLAHVLEQSKVLIHLLSSCTAAHAVATAMLLLPLLLLLMLLHLPCNYLQLHLPGSPAAAPAFHSSFLNELATSLVLFTHFRTELTLQHLFQQNDSMLSLFSDEEDQLLLLLLLATSFLQCRWLQAD